MEWVNSLPHDKILDQSKLKAIADYEIKMTQKLKMVVERLKNTVGKGENAGYKHFLLFLRCFQKATLSESLKVVIV